MTCSVLLKQQCSGRHNPRYRANSAANSMTVLEDQPSHQRSRRAQSLRLSGKPQLNQRLQSVAPAQKSGRRVGAGAGATPVFVAKSRHDPSLARRGSFVGLSRTCPFEFLLVNRHAIRGQGNLISKE
jgi:hypothetical protein